VSNVIIGLDAGHGGQNLGTRHYGIKEELYTLEIAKMLRPMLLDLSLLCHLSRETDETVSFTERAKRLHQADFVLVLHVNAAPQAPLACDLRTYILPGNQIAYSAAHEMERVAPKLVAPKTADPVKVAPVPELVRPYNTLVHYRDKAAVLVEMFFATHEPSARWAQTPAGKAALCAALAAGCIDAWQYLYDPPPAGA